MVWSFHKMLRLERGTNWLEGDSEVGVGREEVCVCVWGAGGSGGGCGDCNWQFHCCAFPPEPLRPGVVKTVEPPWPGARQATAGPDPGRRKTARWRHRQTQAMQEVTSGVISEGWGDPRCSLWTSWLRRHREPLLGLRQASLSAWYQH